MNNTSIVPDQSQAPNVPVEAGQDTVLHGLELPAVPETVPGNEEEVAVPGVSEIDSGSSLSEHTDADAKAAADAAAEARAEIDRHALDSSVTQSQIAGTLSNKKAN